MCSTLSVTAMTGFARALARENLDVFVVDDESLARELGLAEDLE